MPEIIDELNQQPQALRDLCAAYRQTPLLEHLGAQPAARLCIFTGMGASYHAALIAAAHAASRGLPALAIEAIDLLNYQHDGLLRDGHALVYISQSGKSVEVESILEQNAGKARVIAVTDQPGSLLGRSADLCLPILADQQFRLASKNYVNSLAVLWLLARAWSGGSPASDLDALEDVAGRMEALLARGAQTASDLLAGFGRADPLVFLGHGPHAATARQSSLMLSEWARAPSLHAGIGAFRHGFVETVTPDMGVLFFIPPGQTAESALALARALPEFGATVARVANGELRSLNEGGQEKMDEFLSPLLDVIPMQLFAAALSRARDVAPDFRYIDRTRTL